MPYDFVFDASGIPPEQGGVGQAHPPGKFPFSIGNTSFQDGKENSDTGATPENTKMFNVEFTTPAGTIIKRYLLKHPNAQTVDIANRQLSALCHAVGIFKLDMKNDGAALRGARGVIEVDWQWDRELKKPSEKFTEVKKVLDINGNDPADKAKGHTTQAPGNPNAQGVSSNGGAAGWGQQGQPVNNMPAQGQPQVSQGWGPPTGGAPQGQPSWNGPGQAGQQEQQPAQQQPQPGQQWGAPVQGGKPLGW